MDILLVFLAAVVIIFGAVCVNRYWYGKSVATPQKEVKTVKADFVVKFYSPSVKGWCGSFYDEVCKYGYVTNLTENEVKAGDKVRVTVLGYDLENGYWRVAADAV